MPFTVLKSAESFCNESYVLFTQTPGASIVLEKESGVTIIASGSDQPTKLKSPNDALKKLLNIFLI